MQNRKLVIGILAHVDAGKTTLAEGILYTCGALRRMGRVDHKDAFLDNFALERERGITIFSKQAQLEWEDLSITLLDTPGHVDFSAEMERTLQVLDYAILVISGADGVQGHVLTLWRLLKRYEIPVFLFINKMDQEGTERGRLLQELQSRLHEHCVDFGAEEWFDNLAVCDEALLEEYLEAGEISDESIAEAVVSRMVYPCYFGSALRLEGIEGLLNGIKRFALIPEYPEEFGARVFKIARDPVGNRLTYMKITGGELRVKMLVGNGQGAKEKEDRTKTSENWEEKADQLRIYSGTQYTMVDKVTAGAICAVTGLTKTFAGQGLGIENENAIPILEPVLTYQLLLPEGSDPIKVLGQLKQLEEEEPQLHLVWQETTSEIHVQVMGEVQIEILKSLIWERFGLAVEFGAGSIVYKETIVESVEGIGHYEPLRHYAEVHLLMEPGERGSGLQFAALCSEDSLNRNWQRLILTHLEEKRHVGVLTGSEITDMRILLIAGRAHLKHTEGGDFRQATYRAVRQGLRKSKSILLEPVYAFTLEVPIEALGRAMSDIQRMHGTFEPPRTEKDRAVLTGTAPVATMRDYQSKVNAYTRGHGRLSCILKGYEPCHNTEEVMESIHYDPEADLANPTGSVFCAHGAGFVVNWDMVDSYAHVESGWKLKEEKEEGSFLQEAGNSQEEIGFLAKSASENRAKEQKNRTSEYISQEEIEEIFRKTYGKTKEDPKHYRRFHRGNRREYSFGADSGSTHQTSFQFKKEKQEEYFLVDGYNIIFAWQELRELAQVNIDSARDKLMDILCNYQGYLGCTMILVFDAYKVKGNPGSVQKYHNIYVVYTKEAETADQYIEKTVHKIAKKSHVTVATSDALEQMIIWGSGALRMSAQGLKEAVENAQKTLREEYHV